MEYELLIPKVTGRNVVLSRSRIIILELIKITIFGSLPLPDGKQFCYLVLFTEA